MHTYNNQTYSACKFYYTNLMMLLSHRCMSKQVYAFARDTSIFVLTCYSVIFYIFYNIYSTYLSVWICNFCDLKLCEDEVHFYSDMYDVNVYLFFTE